MSGTLYFGDNLRVMRDYIKDETVDLIYLDPPFNSNANYNVLFKSPVEPATAQVRAFEDTWKWGNEAQAAFEEVKERSPDTFRLLLSLKSFLGSSDVMAYLAMMAIRLVEMRRVLRPSGSLYLHCDPTASHYLKILLDGIFGAGNFRNEVIWKRANAHNDPRRFGRISDSLLFYTAGDKYTWNTLHTPYREEYYESHFKRDDEGRWYRTVPLDAPRHGAGSPGLLYEWRGKNPAATRTWAVKRETMEQYEKDGLIRYTRTGTPTLLQYADQMKGVPLQSIWTDIPPVNPQAKERLGYPTQKPIALLDRIIQTSSNAGDVVLDPFCGCGTAIHSAAKSGRKWIGIDITYIAIKVIRDRLSDNLPVAKYVVKGIPQDEESARSLAKDSPHEFQNWAVAVLGGHPRGKGADRGIDGEITFKKGSDEYGRGIVSVKGGKNIAPAMVRELAGTVSRENADFGVFVCLGPATREMKIEAANAGRVDLPGGKWPRLQIITAADLIAGPNLGVHAVLNTVSGAAEAKKVASKKRVAPKKPDPRQKNMMLPLKGGISRDAPRGKTLQFAFHEEQASAPVKKGRRKA